MENTNRQNESQNKELNASEADFRKNLQREIRFWQNLCLNLTLFIFSLIASLFIALIGLLLNK